MKKLLTAVLFAAAIATPLAASAASMPKVEKSVAQPAKAKGVWIDVRSAEEFKEGICKVRSIFRMTKSLTAQIRQPG